MNFETIDLWRKFSNFIVLGDLQFWALPLCMIEYPIFVHGSCCTLSGLGIKMFGTQMGSPHCDLTILKVESFAIIHAVTTYSLLYKVFG